MSNRILIIDDDLNLLSGLRRQLYRRFDVETAETGEQGIALLGSAEPFAVVLCDMRIPGLNGVETLARIREISPRTVRIMLTGNVDQQTAVDAINSGQIFRFLNKPVSPRLLQSALAAGLEQYRLITAEQELLSNTLTGSVNVLTDVLSLVDPPAFARASRVKRMVQELAALLKVERTWELELAASLCQVGCVACRGVDAGRASRLTASQIGHDLIAQIPRLENVAQIVAHQDRRFSDWVRGVEPAPQDSVPFGAGILKMALDYDELTMDDHAPHQALEIMRGRVGWYELRVFDALQQLIGTTTAAETLEVPALSIPEHSVLADDVRSSDGTLLLSKGQEVSAAIRLRLANYARNHHISEFVKIQTAPAKPTPLAAKASS